MMRCISPSVMLPSRKSSVTPPVQTESGTLGNPESECSIQFQVLVHMVLNRRMELVVGEDGIASQSWSPLFLV
jgi:hypothetical protein